MGLLSIQHEEGKNVRQEEESNGASEEGIKRGENGWARKKKAYNTCCSQAVTHPSTGQARRCLTSVIGRELVYSAWYGRRQQITAKKGF